MMSSAQSKISVVGVKQSQQRTLADTTWEERRGKKASELITLMGDGWVGHPQYKARGKVQASSHPLPNLAGVQPTMQANPPNSFCRLVAWYVMWLFS